MEDASNYYEQEGDPMVRCTAYLCLFGGVLSSSSAHSKRVIEAGPLEEIDI